jgi:hypothetical protein
VLVNAAAAAVVQAVVAVAVLLVVPLGLRLLDDPLVARVRRYWLWGAVPGALAPLLTRGGAAAALATAYLALTLVLTGCAAARLARTRSLAPREVAVLTALATPSVGAAALVAERAGLRLFGFDLEVLALTAPHLHVAGFAAALVAGLLCTALPGDRRASAAALTVPAGTLLVLAGYFAGDLVELAGATVLTAGMWAVGWLVWSRLRPGTADPVTRGLLGVAAVVLAATMVLALWWAVGEAFDVPHPSLSWMVLTHGLANALGFGLCAVLAWTRARDEEEAWTG